MPRPIEATNDAPRLSRRAALRRIAAGAFGLGTAGCTPARILLHLYPESFDHDSPMRERVFAAFATTVVPSASPTDPNLIRAYTDARFPLAKYGAFFASDLCRRAQRAGGCHTFDQLDLATRRRVIAEAAADHGATGRLYRGAIYLTQIALYSGFYDDAHGVPAIGFDGPCRSANVAATSYPDAERFLPRPLTADGNPA